MADILIIEDDERMNELILCNMQAAGHRCQQAYDDSQALELLRQGKYDIMILDVLLPITPGFERMVQIYDTPVIYLAALGKAKGALLGEEENTVRSYELEKLTARVDAILRRRALQHKTFALAGVTVDFDTVSVKRNGREIELTPQEFQLLEVLISNQNLALSREKLLRLAWGMEYYGNSRTVDVHIQKLRKKLEWGRYIKTVYKRGYLFETTG